jgi:hypothetical protein
MCHQNSSFIQFSNSCEHYGLLGGRELSDQHKKVFLKTGPSVNCDLTISLPSAQMYVKLFRILI